MKTQTMNFAVQEKDGVIQTVGKGYILQPKTNYQGTGTKWFDDSTLIKPEYRKTEPSKEGM